MKPIWIKVRWFPFVDGMVLYPFIFLKETRWNIPTFRHEKCHAREIVVSMEKHGRIRGWLCWYGGYVWAWANAVLRGQSPWSTAYELRAIAAESDATLDAWGGPLNHAGLL